MTINTLEKLSEREKRALYIGLLKLHCVETKDCRVCPLIDNCDCWEDYSMEDLTKSLIAINWTPEWN